jgi:hypothetical protein
MKELFAFILLMFVSRILWIYIEFILIYKEIGLDLLIFIRRLIKTIPYFHVNIDTL